MLTRVSVVMLNTYREAVRAKVLHGLFALALVTAGYCIVVGQFASGAAARVLSNLGAASMALYGVFVAIVLSATALHREIELKTLFPILARPISRSEYVLGKYLGTLSTLASFILGNAAVFLAALAASGTTPVWQPLLAAVVSLGVAALLGWRVPALRSFAPAVAGALLLAASAWLSSHSPDDRRVLLGAALLTLCEVSVVSGVALLFSAFSSPFLTAIFTFGVFIVGRSASTLAALPVRVFGQAIHDLAELLARVVPNLMLYVPERALLTGEGLGSSPAGYLGMAAAHTLGWAAALLGSACLLFGRRDLT
jgi:ABC-type transport system involved in multi-copper enzyme maturation permease subunit